MRCERCYSDLDSKDNRGFYLSSFRFWYGDSGIMLRSLVFLCFGAISTTYLSLLASKRC